jgi:signal transduction histidine kinase
MMVRRDPSKGLQIGVLALLVVSVALVGYWMADHVIYTRDVEQRFTALYGGDEASITAIAEQSAARINRFLWEGAFFLAVLFGGMGVLTRTIRHDAELRRRQQNFLAAVSHEFKSPLASIRLAAETLVLRAGEPDSKRLGRMVDNLLETTRLEEGRQQLTPVVTPLHRIADEAVAEVAERARLSNVAIAVDVPAGLALSIDPAALETILRNLLDNALKACAASNGRQVRVRAARTADAIELTVSDDGLGFAPEDAAMIFEKFYRLGDEQRRSMPGTGLGLYIVKRLVELSGARIQAHSDGAGTGATVTIRWPRQHA